MKLFFAAVTALAVWRIYEMPPPEKPPVVVYEKQRGETTRPLVAGY